MTEQTPSSARETRLAELQARARNLKDEGGWLPIDQPDTAERTIRLVMDLADLIDDVVGEMQR